MIQNFFINEQLGHVLGIHQFAVWFGFLIWPLVLVIFRKFLF